MGQIRIRDVGKDLVALLKAQAKRHGRTLGEELGRVLGEVARWPRLAIVERLRGRRPSIEAKHGVQADSAAYIRETRDRRDNDNSEREAIARLVGTLPEGLVPRCIAVARLMGAFDAAASRGYGDAARRAGDD